MLTMRQLRQLHDDKVPSHILEVDYIESVLLKGIYSKTDALVFKGGTCLRKAYGLNRFSEDLDFSIKDETVDENELKSALESGLAAMEKSGMTARVKEWQERRNGFLGKILYEGPLFTGKDISRRGIELEISKRPILKPPEWRTIITEYPDTGTYSIQCMSREEILSEKFRTLIQRQKPRDLYDLWFLTKKDTKTDINAVNEKLQEVGLDPASSLVDIVKDYPVTQKDWERDLGILMGRVPDIAQIKRDIEFCLLE